MVTRMGVVGGVCGWGWLWSEAEVRLNSETRQVDGPSFLSIQRLDGANLILRLGLFLSSSLPVFMVSVSEHLLEKCFDSEKSKSY